MRRTIALALMMVFSWTLIAPVFGPDADANLPPCCRRNGKHHCMMRMMERFGSNQKASRPSQRNAPASQPAPVPFILRAYNPETGKQIYAEVVRHRLSAPQTEAVYRVSFLRSHQKRGPPSPLA